MSKICDICGRGPRIAISRSHSHIASKHWQKVNLQSKKIDGQRIKICTACLKKQAKKK